MSALNNYIHVREEGRADGPLLFVFHGTGGDEYQLIQFGQEIVPGATIISPRGDVSESGANRFFKRSGEGVYDMDDLAKRRLALVEFVRAHREREASRPVLALGYSNGANILATMLFEDTLLFDAVALMHPLIPFKPQINGSLQGKDILVTAGQRDPICPAPVTQRLVTYLEEAGAQVVAHWHQGGHEVRPEEIEAAKLFFGGASGRFNQDRPRG